jgi:hypothetical protein
VGQQPQHPIGVSVETVLDEMEIINSFDRDYLIDGIRKYLNFDENCQRFVLYPEAKAER